MKNVTNISKDVCDVSRYKCEHIFTTLNFMVI